VVKVKNRKSKKRIRSKKKRSMRKRKRDKKTRTMEVKRVVEEWEIWDEKKKAAKSKEEAKKLVFQRFYK